jgi:hypothetical protein
MHTVTTKKQALEICIQMWTYMAENDCEKEEAIHALSLPDMTYSCAACDYAEYMEELSGGVRDRCAYCPIQTWSSIQSTDTMCCEDDSPYSIWTEADTTEESKQAALDIVALAQAELDKLGD